MRRRITPAVEPLLVPPKVAFHILSVGRTTGFAMLKDGRLEKVRLGPRSIGVTMASIRRVAANLETSPAAPKPPKARLARPRS